MFWPVLLLLSVPERSFTEERLLLDRRLEALRRILPDGPIAVVDAGLVSGLAEQARLVSVQSLARPPLETGSLGQVAVDLSAVGSYAQIDRFFGLVALSHRLLDVESLSLTGAPGDAIRLTAVLLCPFRPLRTPPAHVPEGARARVSGVPRPQAEAFVADQALALAKSETIAGLRRTRRNPRVFLSELGAAVRERPAIITQATLGEEFSIKGLTVGEGPVRALESRFERGFFRVTQFLVARQGACLRFEVKGSSPVAGPEAELPIPGEDPFEEPDASCAIDRDTPRGPVVQGPSEKTPGKGPLSLRLRDLDLPDVFRVLTTLTGQGFVVDAAVFGRTSVELTRVTLDDALQALAKAANLRFADDGRVRRVATGRDQRKDKKPAAKRAGAAAEEPAPTGPLVSFELKRAPLRDLLGVMADIDPSLASLGPAGSLGRVSVWAKDVPAGALRGSLLAALGLGERWEEGRRIVERPGGGGESLEPIAGDPPDPRLQLRPADLALSEFQPAGLATAGNGWIAFAYAPSGTLYAYRTGDRLADAVVKAVESTDVLLETDEGELRLPVPALAR
jgi:hypothetical protein